MKLRALLSVLTLLVPAHLTAAPPRNPEAPPPVQRTAIFDIGGLIDANQLAMAVTNTGSFAFDKTIAGPGLEFPKGSGRTVLFAGGLWIGAYVNSQVRVTVSEYSDEYGPGAMVGGAPDNAGRPEYRVYKLERSYPSTVERDAALADYNSGAVPHGAPVVSVQPDGTLGIEGDQMLWAVYNDAEPTLHTNDAGTTSPLGVEVQQTTFAFDQPDPAAPLARTIFIRFKVINRGSNQLGATHFGFWFDPDLGEFTDDVVGCNPSRQLGFCYNGDAEDGQYGSSPPVIGVSLLQGPEAFPGGARIGLQGFGSYINGTDPSSATHSYNALQGLDANGNLPVDPTTGFPTPFMFSGDPLQPEGWVDNAPADKRMMLTTGPVTMNPGDEQEMMIALIVGSADSRLNSLRQYLCDEEAVRAFAAGGFSGPHPPPAPCAFPPVACERTADYWTIQCGPGGELDENQLQGVAQRVDERSLFFEWNQSQRLSLCEELAGDLLDPKAAAKREYAALMATIAAMDLDLRTPAGEGFRIDLNRPVACAGLQETTIGELAQTAELRVDGAYEDLVDTNPVPIEGFDWGGTSFGGGAGRSADLFGGPIVDPQDFPEVEIRFDHTQTQYAYRFLRRELPGGGVPAVGRGYVYGGFHPVPFTCWDVTHGVQLEVMFLEKVVTDQDGNFLGPEVQHATYDATWLPDDSFDGNRELLWVLAQPYTGAPRQEIIDNGNPLTGELAATYALWSRRLTAGAVFDDGDRFRFSFSIAGPGVDAALIRLSSQSITDPLVRQAYLDIAACLHAINENDGRGPGCEAPIIPVVANAGSDVTVECASPEGTPVQLDGSLSQGNNLTYDWHADGIAFDNPSLVRPTGAFPFGITGVQLTVISQQGGVFFSIDSVYVTVTDTSPPTVTVSLDPTELWPAHHKLSAVHAEVTAQDGCDASPAIRLLSVTSSEPDAGSNPDDVPNDVQDAEVGTADFDLRLRAERIGQGTGRTYQVCYEARDAAGNAATACADVTVPHDQSGHAALAYGSGLEGLAVFGAWGRPVRSIAAASVEVRNDGFRRKTAPGGAPVYSDVNRDGIEDAVFPLAEWDPGPPEAAAVLFARWTIGAQGYLDELDEGPIDVDGPDLPRKFEASMDANPARSFASIRYAIPTSGVVTVEVFDVAGHQVARLVNGWTPAGRYAARFEPRSAQLYVYRVTWQGTTQTGKFVVLR